MTDDELEAIRARCERARRDGVTQLGWQGNVGDMLGLAEEVCALRAAVVAVRARCEQVEDWRGNSPERMVNAERAAILAALAGGDG